MKLIKALAACLIIGISYGLSTAQTDIMLQAIEPDLSELVLSQAADIIADRLKTAKVKVIRQDVSADGKIQMQIGTETSPNYHEALLTKRAVINFRSIATAKTFLQAFDKDDAIYDLLDISTTDLLRAGTTFVAEVPQKEVPIIDAYLSKKSTRDLDFAWGLATTSDASVPLYLLHSEGTQSTNLLETSVMDCRLDDEGTIFISLDQPGGIKLEKITKSQLGRSLAVMLDDTVLMTPTIHHQITGGSLQITGNFSNDDGRAIVAMLQHGPLPATFKIVQ